MKLTLITIALLVLSAQVPAQIRNSRLLNTRVAEYQKAEWDVTLKAAWENPYSVSEIALDMILTSPSGKMLIQPCFYESGKSGDESLWKARFAARETGTYSYRFELQKNGKVISVSPKAEFQVSASKSRGFLNPNDLWTFRYDNGELFRGIGENICWESRDVDDSRYFKALHEDKRFNYNSMLTKLAAGGGNFFRTWMIYWNLPVDWKTVSNNSRYRNTTSPFNESGMNHMDQLVELCDSLGIHMMLALESHVGFMGDGWKMSSYNTANGGPAKTPYEFFTLPEAKQQYKNKLRLMIARYGYSPSIGAWEFFNEIDNAMYNVKPEDQIPPSVITAWHDEMSTFLKTTDPYHHIITTSVSHRDIAGMNDLKNIDLNQRHIYRNTSAIPSTIREYTAKHNKPYVIGEAGFEWDWSKNFNDFAPDMDADFKRALWYGLFSPTPILPMSWWWEFFENRGMMGYFKTVSEISRRMLNAGNGSFETIQGITAADGLETYGVRCGKQDFVYLYNPSSADAQIRLTGLQLNSRTKTVTVYEPETGQYSTTPFDVLPDKTIRMEALKLHPKCGMILISE
jgi:hypothetical protein